MSKQWPYYYQTQPFYQYQPPHHGNHTYHYPAIQENKELLRGVKEAEIKPSNQREKPQHPEPNVITMSEHFEKIYEKLNKMEEENKQLKEKIENIKPFTIENVNYKIQDLSVQELSGTLLVGLTTLSDAENLKKLLTENGPVKLNDMDTEDVNEQIENNIQMQEDEQLESNQNSNGIEKNN